MSDHRGSGVTLIINADDIVKLSKIEFSTLD